MLLVPDSVCHWVATFSKPMEALCRKRIRRFVASMPDPSRQRGGSLVFRQERKASHFQPVAQQCVHVFINFLLFLPINGRTGHCGYNGAVSQLQFGPAHPFGQTVHAFLIRLSIHHEP